ncbi:PAS domain S-box [Methanolobus tindarius DSM 2278]|uniref:histidine kinase n=1 Tax=Methanolobus tindarius DSM 2278 TaxID=1090322 RepID=W9DXL3_METTI|nr:PAS domain-containing sensor histidine kinase [Methanolobus tindarius]ETA68151.1 PAS domain S-box [Methanolobus tindarius DSM 2278]
MEIEKKDIYLHSSLFIIGIILVVIFSYFLISSNFYDLEKGYSLHNTHMFVHGIEEDEVKTLSSSVSNIVICARHGVRGTDLGNFDDKLSDDEFLINHDIESIIIYNPHNESPLFEHTINGVAPSNDLKAYLSSNPKAFSECMNNFTLSGLVFLPERTLLVAMEYFVPAEGTVEDGLVVVVSRTIDINELEIAQDRSIYFVLEDVGSFSEADKKAPGYKTNDISLSNFENGDPAGAVLLYDIMGHPEKMLKVGTTSHTSSIGLKMAMSIGIALLVVTSIELFFHIYLAKNMSFIEFNLLVKELENIRDRGDLSSRIEVEGDEQVNWLADDINNMLNSLEEKEGKYHALFEQSNDAIMIFGSGASLVDMNSKTSELLGYEKPDLFEINIDSLSPEECPTSLVDIYEQTIRESSVRSEIKLSLSNNNVIDADISSSIIDKEEGTVQVIIRDITEKKIYEEALLQAKLEADAANRSKSQFLANMSHELRTPLNSIIGFSDMLLLKSFGDINEKQERYLNNVSGSGKHLLNLINDILDLSKIEAGMMSLNTEDVIVSELMDEVMGTISSIAVKKNISLESIIDEKLTTMKADRVKIRQTLLNLLSNSVKFTPEKGSVTLEVKKIGNYVQFAVKDTGIGISENDQKYLFYEFTQVDSDHNRKYEGTGLGLALVKKFVEMHGGKVWVKSELGKGSCFYFEIPVDGK